MEHPSLTAKKRKVQPKLWEKAEWIPQCVFLMEGVVKNPKEFCGAFWKDKKQWYHGPVKTDLAFLEKIKEQIEIFPEFYERLDRIEANQVKLGESLKLIQATLDIRDDEDREIMALLHAKMKKAT